MSGMIFDASRRVSMQHVTHTGAALAATLLPLAAAVLLARTTAGDPLAPVNTLVTSGGHRARVSLSVWRGCGRTTLSRWRGATPVRAWCGRSISHPLSRVASRAHPAVSRRRIAQSPRTPAP
jgi:hypothetical protein